MNTKEFSIMLNEQEKNVLEAVIIGHRNAGGDFTYFDEVCAELPNLTIQQVKGYMSQLTQKGFITVSNDEFGQINLKSAVLTIYPDLEETCQVY